MAYARRRGAKVDEAEARRQELLDGTLTVIARKGLSGITINDIAREVGCSYGIVNFYFGTKERLLLAALDVLDEEYERLWRQMVDGAGPAPADRLRAVIDLDFGSRIATRKNIAVWTAFWAETSRVPAYRTRCSDLKRRTLQRIIGFITELADGRDLGMPPEMVARGFYAVSDGCWLHCHITGEAGPAERELGRRICNDYLARFFPDDFAGPAAAGDGDPPVETKVQRLRQPKPRGS